MRKRSILLVFLSLVAFRSLGQNQDQMAEVRKILGALKSTDGVLYDYSLSVSFPDNTMEKLSGTSYFSKQNAISYNESDILVSFYTRDWFYKADHHEKTVYVVNLSTKENRELKKSIEAQLFQNGSLNEFLDSMVFSKGRIKSFSSINDTTKVDMAFPPGNTVKGISFIFDCKGKNLIEYKMDLFFPTEQIDGRTIGSSQKIICRNFKDPDTKEKFRLENFFSVTKDGRILLKKYTDYRLNPES